MIVTNKDDRNMVLAGDLLQLKMLVAVLRQVSSYTNCRQILIEAANEVNKDGFRMTGDDVRVACESFDAVVGYRTDKCLDVARMEELQREKTLAEFTPNETVN